MAQMQQEVMDSLKSTCIDGELVKCQTNMKSTAFSMFIPHFAAGHAPYCQLQWVHCHCAALAAHYAANVAAGGQEYFKQALAMMWL